MGVPKKENLPGKSDTDKELYIVRNDRGENYEVIGNDALSELMEKTSVKEIFVKKSSRDVADTIESKLSFMGAVDNEEDLKVILDKEVDKTPQIYNRFFSITNNSEIFRIGKLYSQDVEMGMRYFAFAADGDIESLVKAQFGLVAYFNFHIRKTITILATAKEIEEWGKRIDLTEENIVEDKKNCGSYRVHVGEGIVLVDIFSFKSKINEQPPILMQKFLNDAEVVFCSLPGVRDLERNAKRYFEILQNVDNVTIVAKRESSSLKSVGKLIKKLENYNVTIKGAMYE